MTICWPQALDPKLAGARRLGSWKHNHWNSHHQPTNQMKGSGTDLKSLALTLSLKTPVWVTGSPGLWRMSHPFPLLALAINISLLLTLASVFIRNGNLGSTTVFSISSGSGKEKLSHWSRTFRISMVKFTLKISVFYFKTPIILCFLRKIVKTRRCPLYIWFCIKDQILIFASEIYTARHLEKANILVHLSMIISV